MKLRIGLATTVFHEGLTLINRDRAAAYFADMEEGAQSLICSEIGSEGRNFQFASHLVMFDLPLNPDLLEQRIGRLDRIGQENTIQIHVPYFQESAQEILFRWYHEGLNAFTEISPAGPSLFDECHDDLLTALADMDTALTDQLITRTHQRALDIKEVLHAGRDQLLERHSFNKQHANTLIDEIVKNEQSVSLKKYMERVFLLYGLNYEEQSANGYYVYPGEHMSVHHFPELPDDGLSITFSRETALSREDLQFLTWEHPMVTGCMDMILNGDKGNTALITITQSPFRAGEIILETVFTISCVAPPHLQVTRYLPTTIIRLLMDSRGQNISENMSTEEINLSAQKVKRHLRQEVVKHQQTILNNMIDASQKLAETKIAEVLSGAQAKMLAEQTAEIKRMVALQEVNPNIREEEIEFLRQQTMSIHEHLQKAQLKMEAIRVIVPT